MNMLFMSHLGLAGKKLIFCQSEVVFNSIIYCTYYLCALNTDHALVSMITNNIENMFVVHVDFLH